MTASVGPRERLRALIVSGEQSEDAELIAAITLIVRDADQAFEKAGGGSRPWVRECFLPTLNAEGYRIVSVVCSHCGEQLWKFPEGWLDRETHSTCANPNEDEDDIQRHTPILVDSTIEDLAAEVGRDAAPVLQAQEK